jgi:hypothetical protein
MDRFAARRKLLRGSLSAPLVLTVASPAALAQQSFEACLHRATTAGNAGVPPRNVDVFLPSAQHDPWLRAKVKLYQGRLNGGNRVQQSNNVNDPIFYEIVGKEGRFYPKATTCPSPGFGGYLPQGQGPTNLNTQEQALVFVRNDGTIVGFGNCPNGGYAVTTSCYASFGGLDNLP